MGKILPTRARCFLHIECLEERRLFAGSILSASLLPVVDEPATVLAATVSTVTAPVSEVVDSALVPTETQLVSLALPIVDTVAPAADSLLAPLGPVLATVADPLASVVNSTVAPVENQLLSLAQPAALLLGEAGNGILVPLGEITAPLEEDVTRALPSVMPPWIGGGPLGDLLLQTAGPVLRSVEETGQDTLEQVPAAPLVWDLWGPEGPLGFERSLEPERLEQELGPGQELDPWALPAVLAALWGDPLPAEGDAPEAPAVGEEDGPQAAAEPSAEGVLGADSEVAEAPAPLQTFPILADCSPFDGAALDLAVARLLDQLAQLRGHLASFLAGMGPYGWLLAATVAAAACEYKHRQARRAAGLCLASNGADGLLSWSLGIPGNSS